MVGNAHERQEERVCEEQHPCGSYGPWQPQKTRGEALLRGAGGFCTKKSAPLSLVSTHELRPEASALRITEVVLDGAGAGVEPS